MKATLILFATLFSASLWAQQAPPTGSLITGVSTHGAGCKQATVAAILSPDSQALSLLFDNFILDANASKVDPRTLRVESSCTADVSFHIPYGWQMALVSVDYRGFAAVPAGTMGYQRFLYQGPNMPVVSLRDAQFIGPYNDNYSFTAQQKPGRYAYTPCGMTDFTLPMTAVLGVYYQRRGVYPDAQVALDSQDLSMAQQFQVAWQRCM